MKTNNFFSFMEEYLNIVNGSCTMDQVIRMVNEEIRGIIDGDKNMTWISPDKRFKFVLDRTENSMINYENPDSGKFIVIINIFDNFTGVFIMTLRFSELDTIRILESIVDFYENYYQTYDSYYIYINPKNTFMENNIIYLENIHEVINSPTGQEINYDVLFKIQTHQYGQTIFDKIVMKLSYDDLYDLTFHLFFNAIIDIDIDDKYIDKIEYIEDYILGGVDYNRQVKNQMINEDNSIPNIYPLPQPQIIQQLPQEIKPSKIPEQNNNDNIVKRNYKPILMVRKNKK